MSVGMQRFCTWLHLLLKIQYNMFHSTFHFASEPETCYILMSAFSSQGMVEIFEQSVYNEIP